ncbi:MAG: hypothetical protein ACNA8P_05120 [Phycisphaerales bacterium]
MIPSGPEHPERLIPRVDRAGDCEADLDEIGFGCSWAQIVTIRTNSTTSAAEFLVRLGEVTGCGQLWGDRPVLVF